jgi:8-amino-7-oxononanoate synthase
VLATIHTGGKALGSGGAWVAGSRALYDVLVNRARSFIFSTAPSPLIAAAVRAALRLCKEEPERREKLASLIAFANAAIKERCGIEGSGSQIVPVVVGADTRATALAAAMRGYGYDIRAIRPPTVPEKTARLRISLTLNTSEATVSDMLDALAHELPRIGG